MPRKLVHQAVALTLALTVLSVVTACGAGSAKPVPNVMGKRLDVAENRLDQAGLHHETIGGGTFGIVVRSRWTVCDQEPKAGTRATSVKLIVERSCPGNPVPVVPDVVGESLEDAEEQLDEVGLDYTVVGGGEHGVVVKHFWRVCDQAPGPGARGRTVELYIDRTCFDDD